MPASGWPSPYTMPTWPGVPIAPHLPYGVVPPAAYGRQPSRYTEPPADGSVPDPFQQAEHDIRATVAAPWWPTAAPIHRQQALAVRLLTLPDHTWWLYGAWARWYRRHPADGRWFPCPPPRDPVLRRSARYPQPGYAPPAIPAELLPTGPDFSYDFGTPLAVVAQPISGAARYRLQKIVSEAALAPSAEFPLGWHHFLHGTPSTVAATWSALLWCADAPLFDAAAGGPLLELWQPFLARPPAVQGRFRWLAAPPLTAITGLYAERLAAGRPDAAGQLARHMAMTAQALRDDPRFHTRATTLLAMIEPIQLNPAVDHHALAYGGQGVEREWLGRCPAPLVTALFADTAPGECFQLALYDLARTLEPLCGEPTAAGFVEPRHAALALLAADLGGYRPDLAEPVGDWLDPELRTLLAELLDRPGHPLRALWPVGGALPELLRRCAPPAALEVLGAMAALDFAWCQLAKGIPIPAGGFPVPDAFAVFLETPEADPADEPPAPEERPDRPTERA